MSPTDDKLCVLPFQHLRCRCLSIPFTTSDWHLRTWFRGAHSGGRLMLDSKSLTILFLHKSPSEPSLFLTAGAQRKWSLSWGLLWKGKHGQAAPWENRPTTPAFYLSTKEVLTNQQCLTNPHSALNLQLTVRCQRAQKSGLYHFVCLRTPGKKEKVSRSSSQLWQKKPWLPSGWASPPTHSHLSSSISITA